MIALHKVIPSPQSHLDNEVLVGVRKGFQRIVYG